MVWLLYLVCVCVGGGGGVNEGLNGQETHMYLLWDQSLHTYGGMSYVILRSVCNLTKRMLIRC